jgi:hypothetical protein
MRTGIWYKEMRIEVTPEELETQVRAAAANAPDFVYDASPGAGKDASCAYFNKDGTPSCLIGQGFSALGLTAEDFSEDSYNFMAVSDFLHAWQGTPTDACEWLSDVQARQDRGDSWNNAVNYADEQRKLNGQVV